MNLVRSRRIARDHLQYRAYVSRSGPHKYFGLMPDPSTAGDERTPESASASMATLIGNPAPAFDLPCTRFPDPARSRVSLADYRGRWLVLVFYPRDFSLVCPTELIGLSQRFDEFAAQNCELLGVSCDSVESHERWIATPMSRGGLGGLSFPLGSDLDGSAARAYGVYPGEGPPGGARVVHHRPGGPGAIPGRPQPERRPTEPGGLACAGGLAVGRVVPRGLDGRRPDDRSVSGDPAGELFFPLPDRGRGGLGDVCAGLSCAGTFSSIGRWRSRSSSPTAR